MSSLWCCCFKVRCRRSERERVWALEWSPMHDTGLSLLSLLPLPAHTQTGLVVSSGLLNAHWYACGNFTVKILSLCFWLSFSLSQSLCPWSSSCKFTLNYCQAHDQGCIKKAALSCCLSYALLLPLLSLCVCDRARPLVSPVVYLDEISQGCWFKFSCYGDEQTSVCCSSSETGWMENVCPIIFLFEGDFVFYAFGDGVPVCLC